MRLFDADPPLVKDLKDESESLGAKETAAFTVFARRHPTLGRLVIVEGRDGSGVVVETDE